MNTNIEQIINLIISTKRLLHQQIESKDCSNASFMHTIVLSKVKMHSPLMKDIATFLGIAPPSATSLVDTLVKAGLVKREEDKNDRRLVRIIITKKGENFLEDHRKMVIAKMTKRLSRLTQQEQKELISILEKIVE